MKLFVLFFLFGVATAQRGSYGGSSPIVGQRYGSSTSSQPAQSNFVEPSQGTNNRFNGNTQQQQPIFQQQQPSQGGFGGFGPGYPNNQGFQQFQFAPTGFNG